MRFSFLEREVVDMSKPRKVNGTCGKCHASFDVTIWDSINTDLASDLPMRIISGEFFKHKCPRCGSVSYLEYPVLYHDLKNKAMIWVVLNGEGDKSQIDEIRNTFIPRGYITRIVRSISDLREKVSILEANRDDCIIELRHLTPPFLL